VNKYRQPNFRPDGRQAVPGEADQLAVFLEVGERQFDSLLPLAIEGLGLGGRHAGREGFEERFVLVAA
jgi:hypothetical protein